MLIMTPVAQAGIYQTIKTEILSMVQTYLKANPITDLSTLIAYIQNNIPDIPGIPKGFNLGPDEIFRHIKQFNQMQVIDGNNCIEQTINGQKVMVSNGDPIVIV